MVGLKQRSFSEANRCSALTPLTPLTPLTGLTLRGWREVVSRVPQESESVRTAAACLCWRDFFDSHRTSVGRTAALFCRQLIAGRKASPPSTVSTVSTPSTPSTPSALSTLCTQKSTIGRFWLSRPLAPSLCGSWFELLGSRNHRPTCLPCAQVVDLTLRSRSQAASERPSCSRRYCTTIYTSLRNRRVHRV